MLGVRDGLRTCSRAYAPSGGVSFVDLCAYRTHTAPAMSTDEYAVNFPRYCRNCSGIGGHKTDPARHADRLPGLLRAKPVWTLRDGTAGVRSSLPFLRLARLRGRGRSARRKLRLKSF